MSKSKKSNAQELVFHLGSMLAIEKEEIKARRLKKNQSPDLEQNSLGLALSGGGIRSATICLGIVEILNQKKILEKTDYLSTVSGGGYLGAYIHTALNDQKKRLEYKDLFNPEDVAHLRAHREYLYIFPNHWIGRLLSRINLVSVWILSMFLNLSFLLLPFVFLVLVNHWQAPTGMNWNICCGGALVLAMLLGTFISPNFSSPHRFYKRRLSKAYLSRNPKIKLTELNNPLAPYPLINATVHVNYDKYDKYNLISYRGRIKSNYFLFSPLFCGSQVTRYTKTSRFHFKNKTLATAMATSAAAVHTFMGNQKIPSLARYFMAIANLRTGILAPNPQLKSRHLTFWPRYTALEILGLPNTTTKRIQVSDGGHIENLGVYELLRRQVKVIIAVDAGQDEDFKFEDLRNLAIRSSSELGIDFVFHDNALPENLIKPSASMGFSNRNFVVAKLVPLEGSYAKDNNYEGLFIYIKSSVLVSKTYELRKMKKALVNLGDPGKDLVKIQEVFSKKRALDSWMYKTYNPDFPHESTADQFFDESQWDSYHALGKLIGENICENLGIEKGMDGADLYEKGKSYFEAY